MMGQQEAQQNILAQQQLAQAQQQNAMARMQMAEYERARKEEDEIRNYFARAQAAGQDITSPEFIRGIYGVSPKTGTTYEQAVAARQKASSEEAARRTKLAADKTTMYRDALVDVRTPADAAKWLQIQAADPDMAGTPVAKTPIMEAVRRIPTDPAAFEQWKASTAMGLGKYIEANRVEYVDLAGVKTPVLRLTGQPALGVAPLPIQPMPPAVEAQKTRIALASRPPREPAAPTVAQIQDPTDPNRMLTIDARRYAGGGIGSPGVIGTSGKAAPIAAAEQKKMEGNAQLQTILDTLQTAYAELDTMRAIPSEQRGVISNALSYIASTDVGQLAGRVGGTPEQTQRNIIQGARNQLLVAVKNATGMSAQQLNSNVEFKSWIESLTDPTKSIESNQAILENLEKFVASGGKYSAKKPGETAAPAATPGAATGIEAERANARAAISRGAPEAAVRARFKEKTGQEL